MKDTYAKVIVEGSPISKSNFKLFNMNGRAILPYNSGKYHDRYALYEEEIALKARAQNPNIVIEESVIAILKVYYKSKKRHPDTNNITKSIFDGIEKSGLIINDAQIRRIMVEEFYDKENPRFELELFGESVYSIEYTVLKSPTEEKPILYSPPSNSKNTITKNTINKKSKNEKNIKSTLYICELCNKEFNNSEMISANKGQTLICKNCFKKLF